MAFIKHTPTKKRQTIVHAEVGNVKCLHNLVSSTETLRNCNGKNDVTASNGGRNSSTNIENRDKQNANDTETDKNSPETQTWFLQRQQEQHPSEQRLKKQ